MIDQPKMLLIREAEGTYIRADDLVALLELCAREMAIGGEVEAAFILRAVENFVHSVNTASTGIAATALDYETLAAGLRVIRPGGERGLEP